MGNYRIFTINPGSTSTKIALFEGDKMVFSTNVNHDEATLSKYDDVSDQLPYRKETILNELSKANVSLEGCDAFVGRGGGLLATEGGTYDINDLLLDHATNRANGVQHPAQLGPQLAAGFSKQYGAPAFVVNPPDTDELDDIARYTGVKGIYRNIHLHALNLKETAIRHSASVGKRYEDCNYIVCHLGGGISISAHRKGRMVDGTDIVGGEGPMAPTRCGAMPASEIIDLCFSGVSKAEAKALCTRSGGFVSYFGSADGKAIEERASNGDAEARQIWDTMIYQTCKFIGEMAVVLEGKVDALLLGGGMVYNPDLVRQIAGRCDWIAPLHAYPGEFELEAMAAGAARVLDGVEKCKTYTGKKNWKSVFSDDNA